MTNPKRGSVESRFVQYALSLIGVVVALGPILGTAHVRGFAAVSEVFPTNMQKGLVPFASILFMMAALAAHFFDEDRVGKPRLNRLFQITWALVIVLTMLVYFFYSSYVVQVDFEGGRESASYVVGDQMLPECPCARERLDIATCVGRTISANPAEVTACYPRAETNRRRAILGLTYLLLMTFFGMALALAVKKAARKARPVTMKPSHGLTD